MTFSVLTSSPCERGEVYFDLLLLTDGKGYEIAWMLRDTITDVTLLSGDGYLSYTQISIAQCIPANCYTFVITDSGGDGLCCDQGYGGYSVRLNGLKLAAGNAFGNKVEVDLQCLLTPTASPTHEVSSSYYTRLLLQLCRISTNIILYVLFSQPTIRQRVRLHLLPSHSCPQFSHQTLHCQLPAATHPTWLGCFHPSQIAPWTKFS